jgi:hypothetical protein
MIVRHKCRERWKRSFEDWWRALLCTVPLVAAEAASTRRWRLRALLRPADDRNRVHTSRKLIQTNRRRSGPGGWGRMNPPQNSSTRETAVLKQNKGNPLSATAKRLAGPAQPSEPLATNPPTPRFCYGHRPFETLENMQDQWGTDNELYLPVSVCWRRTCNVSACRRCTG